MQFASIRREIVTNGLAGATSLMTAGGGRMKEGTDDPRLFPADQSPHGAVGDRILCRPILGASLTPLNVATLTTSNNATIPSNQLFLRGGTSPFTP